MDGLRLISANALFQLLDGASAPLIVDVRRAAAFDADIEMLAWARRGAPDNVAGWGQQVPAGQQVVVYCVYGHEVSQGVAKTLCESGTETRYLAGGITGRAELGLPLRKKAETGSPATPGDQAQ
jgi:Fe-Mn family superoxide dismutase